MQSSVHSVSPVVITLTNARVGRQEWRITVPPSAEAPPSPTSLPPWRIFVGRGRELHELDAIADDVRRGRGRLV